MSSYPASSAARPALTPWWTAILFVLGVMVVGAVPGRLTFALDPNAAARIGLGEVPVPGWVFTTVWIIAYPAMGVATWLIWRKRGTADVGIPLAIFFVALVQTTSFWLTDSLRMTAMIDATGMVLAYTVAWVYSRYDKVAVWWLLPWLVWMPTTLGIKLWALLG
jgi:tryptophan-rich sensory protein